MKGIQFEKTTFTKLILITIKRPDSVVDRIQVFMRRVGSTRVDRVEVARLTNNNFKTLIMFVITISRLFRFLTHYRMTSKHTMNSFFIIPISVFVSYHNFCFNPS